MSTPETNTQAKPDPSPTANLQSARMALTAARQIILEQASTLEHGAARRGMMSARSAIGLMLDEMAMKARPCDTIVDLLIALSLPSKANDLETAKTRLKEILPQPSITHERCIKLAELEGDSTPDCGTP